MTILTLDGQSYQGECDLGTSLEDFLRSHGGPSAELIFDADGTPFAPRYTLAHAVNGKAFTLKGEVGEAVAALTIDQLMTATV